MAGEGLLRIGSSAGLLPVQAVESGVRGALGNGQGLLALEQQAQLRQFLFQLIAFVLQLAQFIATDSDVKGLCWQCGLYGAHCSPRKWRVSTVDPPKSAVDLLSAPILISFALEGNFFIFHGRCVFDTIPDVISLDRAQCPETSSRRSGLSFISRVGLYL